MEQFDLTVVGAGPGGYVAAIRASQLGMKVAVVEKRPTLGGVCLNEGCIPSKALLDSSEHFTFARDKFSAHGIVIDPPKLNLSVMLARKDDVVRKLTDGIAYLFKKHKIPVIQGSASLQGQDEDGLHLVAVDGVITLKSERVLLATGSEPVPLSAVPFDGERVVSAKEALCFENVPDHLVVIGGGYIGLELGSVWRRLGARVTVVEALPHLIPSSDRQVADYIQRMLKKQGLRFMFDTKVAGVEHTRDAIHLHCSCGEQSETVICDRVLVSIGRRPQVSGLGLEKMEVRYDQAGRITVDSDYQTSVKNLYAIGDLIAGPMLAHKASEEAVACVERMHGETSSVHYESLPGVVYTWPEGASVGKTEEQLKATATPYKTGKFNFMANGRARAMDEVDGFVKVLAHAETDLILGIHIVGPRASDLIGEAVTAIRTGSTAHALGQQFHAHPSLGEALKEAALDLHKEAIHA